MPKKLTGILTSTRKPLVFTLLAAGMLVLMILGGALVLHSHGAEKPSIPVDEVDTSRSQIMVTGEGYTLNQAQGVAMEREQEQREQFYQQQPPQPQTIGAPSTRYNQIARRYTPSTRTPYTYRPYTGRRTTTTPTRPQTTTPTQTTPKPDKPEKPKKPTKPAKKPEKSDTSDEKPKDDTPATSDTPGDNGTEDPAGKPVITTNLTNGDTINGDQLSFSVEAKSHKGKKIAQSNFTVTVNGTEIYGSGGQYKGLYSCSLTGDSSSPLKAGKNVIKITVKDTDGNKVTTTLRVTLNPEEEAEAVGSASLVITANNIGLGTIYSSGDVEITKDEKVSHFFQRVMEKAGISFESSGSADSDFYLKRISQDGILDGYTITDEQIDAIGKTLMEPENHDSLGEKDFFPQAGWMFSVNGSTPDSGMASGTISDGDEVEIWFTLDGGNDEDTH